MTTRQSRRYYELDGLRGIAVLTVVGFHYLTRFDERFPGYDAAPFGFDIGQYGVHLFFLISGFVILMTVRRSKQPSDFAIGRFSRLYPTYIACVVVTLIVVTVARLPDRVTNPFTILLNLTMVQSLLFVPSVDGVYWSLGIEVLFYGYMWILMLRSAVQPRAIRSFCVGWTGLGLVMAALSHAPLPARAFDLIQLATLSDYAWLFSLGMLMYMSREAGKLDRSVPAVFVIGIASQAIAHGWRVAVIVGVIGLVFVLVTTVQRVPFLGLRPFQFLGAVSYPLYLLHQNIGYVVMRFSIPKVGRIPAMLLATALSLVLATVVHRQIEGPMSRWARKRALTLRDRLVVARSS